MAGPSTVGSIGLDIREFSGPWADVMAELNQLEPELKKANAQLKLMERQFRGAAAGGNVNAKSLEAQRKTYNELLALQKQLKLEAKAFGAEEVKENGLLGTLKKAATTSALLGFSHALFTTGREASELTRRLDELDKYKFAEKFDDNARAAIGWKGALLDVVGAISSIPVIGQAFEVVTAPFLEIVKHKQDMIDFRKSINQSAEGTDGLLSKLSSLEEERDKLQKKSGTAGSTAATNATLLNPAMVMGTMGASALAAYAINKKRQADAKENAAALTTLEAKRAEIVEKIAGAYDRETKSRNASLSGSQKASELAAIESDRLKQIAALEEITKNTKGERSDAGKKALKDGTEFINKEADARGMMAEKNYAITIDTLATTKKIAELQSLGDKGKERAAILAYELAKRTEYALRGTGTEAERIADTNLAKAEAIKNTTIRTNEDMARGLRLQTIQIEAQQKGYTAIARRAEIIAKFQQPIIDAARAGNAPAVAELQQQQALAIKAGQAADHDETPADRRKARAAARAINRKSNQQLARERDIRNRQARGAVDGARGGAIAIQNAKDDAITKAMVAQVQALVELKKINDTLTKGK